MMVSISGRWQYALCLVLSVLFQEIVSIRADSFGTADCGGQVTASSVRQFLMTPGWPKSQVYSTTCRWEISVPDGFVVELEFLDIDLDMCCDYLYVSHLSSDATISTIRSSTSEIFRSNLGDGFIVLLYGPGFTVAKRGIQLVYRAVDARPTTPTPSPSTSALVCGGKLDVLRELSFISSPGWPKEFDPNLMMCQWFLYPPRGYSVELKFIDMDMNSCCDYIDVFLQNSAVTVPRITSKTTEVYKGAPSSRVELIFWGPGFTAKKRGFQASVIATCNYKLTVSNETKYLTSPNFELEYQANSDCSWELEAEDGKQIELRFEEFITEQCCDSVSIYGTAKDLELRGIHTGLTVRSVSGILNIRFKTDEKNNAKGFSATYKAVVPTPVPECGEDITVTSSGNIFSPGYPSSPYPSNMDCWWRLMAPDVNDQIEIEVDVFASESCCDYVKIYEGEEVLVWLRGTYNHAPIYSYKSKGNSLRVHFHSDSTAEMKGFNLYYVLQRKPKVITAGCSDNPPKIPFEKRMRTNVTLSGRTCQAWGSQYPHEHTRTPDKYPFFDLLENYCRNLDRVAGMWCYTTDPDVRWELCEVPKCQDHCSGITTNGRNYRGNVSATKSGLSCQPWASQLPHEHTRTLDAYPGTGLAGNYCRNPDDSDGPWCYTNDPKVRWEYCDIPECTESCSYDPPVISDREFISRTLSGRICQSWASQSPHRHTWNPEFYSNLDLSGNLCRNPDRTLGLWCFTTDPDVRRELCEVSKCTDDCYDPATNGHTYRGYVNITKTRRTCQAWSAQLPHTHSRTPELYPGRGLEKNFCRNPDDSDSPWCYTTDSDVRWEYCDVTACPALVTCDVHLEYQCLDSSVCIPLTRKCDGYRDCEYGDDEEGCVTKVDECEADEFKCGPGDCIDEQMKCDGKEDCSNGFDEKFCAICSDNPPTIPPEKFFSLTKTINGRECQAWTSQYPHSHTRTPGNYPQHDLRKNYCRNPDGESGIWCYTTDPDVRWEYCEVQRCMENCSFIPSARKTDNVNVTLSGRTCQAWNSQSPHQHRILLLDDAKNYCRNPDNKPALWCFTTDPDVRWELCEVPKCTVDCYDVETKGSTYRGNLTTTKNGIICQAWSAQLPHKHTRTPQAYTGFGLEENYCRNPDKSDMPWCYTINSYVRWEYCDVSLCADVTTTETPITHAPSIIPSFEHPVNCGNRLRRVYYGKVYTFLSPSKTPIRCKWLFRAKRGMLVQFTFHQPSVDPCCGSAKFYDASRYIFDWSSSYLIDSLNNTIHSGNKIQSPSFMTGLLYKSNSTKTRFSMTYKVVVPSDMNCGFNTVAVRKIRRNFQTPGWPKSYPNNLNCTWQISTKDKRRGSQIKLELRNVGVSDPNDTLTIYDGDTFITSYSGSSAALATFVSTTGKFRIHFKSNFFKSGKGFRAYYKLAEPQDLTTMTAEPATTMSTATTQVLTTPATTAVMNITSAVTTSILEMTSTVGKTTASQVKRLTCYNLMQVRIWNGAVLQSRNEKIRCDEDSICMIINVKTAGYLTGLSEEYSSQVLQGNCYPRSVEKGYTCEQVLPNLKLVSLSGFDIMNSSCGIKFCYDDLCNDMNYPPELTETISEITETVAEKDGIECYNIMKSVISNGNVVIDRRNKTKCPVDSYCLFSKTSYDAGSFDVMVTYGTCFPHDRCYQLCEQISPLAAQLGVNATLKNCTSYCCNQSLCNDDISAEIQTSTMSTAVSTAVIEITTASVPSRGTIKCFDMKKVTVQPLGLDIINKLDAKECAAGYSCLYMQTEATASSLGLNMQLNVVYGSCQPDEQCTYDECDQLQSLLGDSGSIKISNLKNCRAFCCKEDLCNGENSTQVLEYTTASTVGSTIQPIVTTTSLPTEETTATEEQIECHDIMITRILSLGTTLTNKTSTVNCSSLTSRCAFIKASSSSPSLPMDVTVDVTYAQCVPAIQCSTDGCGQLSQISSGSSSLGMLFEDCISYCCDTNLCNGSPRSGVETTSSFTESTRATLTTLQPEPATTMDSSTMTSEVTRSVTTAAVSISIERFLSTSSSRLVKTTLPPTKIKCYRYAYMKVSERVVVDVQRIDQCPEDSVCKSITVSATSDAGNVLSKFGSCFESSSEANCTEIIDQRGDLAAFSTAVIESCVMFDCTEDFCNVHADTLKSSTEAATTAATRLARLGTFAWTTPDVPTTFPAPTMAETGRELQCYDVLYSEALGIAVLDNQKATPCKENSVCMLLAVNTSVTVSGTESIEGFIVYGMCYPASLRASTSCKQVFDFMDSPRMSPTTGVVEIKDCRLSFCEDDLCNDRNGPDLPVHIPTEMRPTVDKTIQCAKLMRMDPQMTENSNFKSHMTCPVGSSCFLNIASVTMEAAFFQRTFNVTSGGCILSELCDYSRCDQIKNLLPSTIAGVEVEITDCEASCCTDDLCNDISVTEVTSIATDKPEPSESLTCYESLISTGVGKNEEKVCAPQSKCVLVKATVATEALPDVQVTTYYGDCMAEISCGLFDCKMLDTVFRHMYDESITITSCDISCCDSDLCNLAPVEAITLTPSLPEPSQSPGLVCYDTLQTVGIGKKIEKTCPPMSKCVLIDAKALMPSVPGSVATTTYGDCISAESCDFMNCDMMEAIFQSSFGDSIVMSSCNIACCDTNLCNSDIKVVTSPAPPPLTSSPPRSIKCYDLITTSGVGKKVIKECPPDYSCVLAVTTANLRDLRMNVTSFFGNCVPSVGCSALTCDSVLGNLQGMNSLSITSCDINCCDNDYCNNDSLYSNGTVAVTRKFTPMFSAGKNSLPHRNNLTCYDVMTTTGLSRKEEKTCSPFSKCVLIESTVVMSSLPSLEVQTVYGDCANAATCEYMNCQGLNSVFGKLFGESIIVSSCNISCCDTDLCNSGKQPGMTSPIPPPLMPEIQCYKTSMSSLNGNEPVGTKESRKCPPMSSCLIAGTVGMNENNSQITTLYGDCISTSICSSVTCGNITTMLSNITRNVSFIACDVTCCESDLCNTEELLSPVTAGGQNVTIPLEVLYCHLSLLTTGFGMTSGSQGIKACPAGSSCVYAKATASMGAVQDGLVTTIFGDCMNSVACRAMSCDSLSSVLMSGTDGMTILSCETSCCDTDFCNVEDELTLNSTLPPATTSNDMSSGQVSSPLECYYSLYIASNSTTQGMVWPANKKSPMTCKENAVCLLMSLRSVVGDGYSKSDVKVMFGSCFNGYYQASASCEQVLSNLDKLGITSGNSSIADCQLSFCKDDLCNDHSNISSLPVHQPIPSNDTGIKCYSFHKMTSLFGVQVMRAETVVTCSADSSCLYSTASIKSSSDSLVNIEGTVVSGSCITKGLCDYQDNCQQAMDLLPQSIMQYIDESSFSCSSSCCDTDLCNKAKLSRTIPILQCYSKGSRIGPETGGVRHDSSRCLPNSSCVYAKALASKEGYPENSVTITYGSCIASSRCSSITCDSLPSDFSSLIEDGDIVSTCAVACCDSSFCNEETIIGPSLPVPSLTPSTPPTPAPLVFVNVSSFIEEFSCYKLSAMFGLGDENMSEKTEKLCPPDYKCILVTATFTSQADPESKYEAMYGDCISSSLCSEEFSLCKSMPYLMNIADSRIEITSCKSSCCGSSLCNDAAAVVSTVIEKPDPHSDGEIQCHNPLVLSGWNRTILSSPGFSVCQKQQSCLQMKAEVQSLGFSDETFTINVSHCVPNAMCSTDSCSEIMSSMKNSKEDLVPGGFGEIKECSANCCTSPECHTDTLAPVTPTMLPLFKTTMEMQYKLKMLQHDDAFFTRCSMNDYLTRSWICAGLNLDGILDQARCDNKIRKSKICQSNVDSQCRGGSTNVNPYSLVDDNHRELQKMILHVKDLVELVWLHGILCNNGALSIVQEYPDYHEKVSNWCGNNAKERIRQLDIDAIILQYMLKSKNSVQFCSAYSKYKNDIIETLMSEECKMTSLSSDLTTAFRLSMKVFTDIVENFHLACCLAVQSSSIPQVDNNDIFNTLFESRSYDHDTESNLRTETNKVTEPRTECTRKYLDLMFLIDSSQPRVSRFGKYFVQLETFVYDVVSRLEFGENTYVGAAVYTKWRPNMLRRRVVKADLGQYKVQEEFMRQLSNLKIRGRTRAAFSALEVVATQDFKNARPCSEKIIVFVVTGSISDVPNANKTREVLNNEDVTLYTIALPISGASEEQLELLFNGLDQHQENYTSSFSSAVEPLLQYIFKRFPEAEIQPMHFSSGP